MKSIDSEDDFYRMVVIMRRCQKDYFRTRNKNVLERSKEYEKVVDDYINRRTPDQLEYQQMSLDL